MTDKNENKDINVEERNVTRKENPSMVGSTLIKYVAYIVMLLIVLYFLINYVFPKF